MRFYDFFRWGGLILITFAICGCTAVTRELQYTANTSTHNSLSKDPANPALDKPQTVDLSLYKLPHHRSDVSIAVAASGGGYRAANLVLGVLMGLEKIKDKNTHHNLLQDVNYYSTVSGGGFGVGYYIDQLNHYLLNHPGQASHFSLNNTVNLMLSDDQEDRIPSNPLRADLSDMLFFGDERGQLITQHFDQTLLASPHGGLRLSDIFIPKNSRKTAQLPIWVTNATVYQNMAIFPFTPDVLARYQATNYFHNKTLMAISGDVHDTCYACEIPISIGLTASASVPIAIPPTTLMSKGCVSESDDCYIHLYDGGLADNLGVYTAMSLLYQDKSPTKVLIIIDAYTGDVAPYTGEMALPNNVSLLLRIMTTITDANHENIQTKIPFIAHDILCRRGARQVMVIHLSLRDFPKALKVHTGLNMDLSSQKILIAVGEKLVKAHPELKKLLDHSAQLMDDKC